jgi:hypothetical protein
MDCWKTGTGVVALQSIVEMQNPFPKGLGKASDMSYPCRLDVGRVQTAGGTRMLVYETGSSLARARQVGIDSAAGTW